MTINHHPQELLGDCIALPLICSYAPWSFIMGWFCIALGIILFMAHPKIKSVPFDFRMASFHIQASLSAILIIVGIVMVSCNEIYSGVIYLSNALGKGF